MALAHLARVAAAEEGDFSAAKQAFQALLRLAGLLEQRGRQLPGLDSRLPSANPVWSAVQVLKTFSTIDHMLVYVSLHAAWELAVLGDIRFSHFDPREAETPAIFFPIVQVLCLVGLGATSSQDLWMGCEVARVLAGLLLGVGMILHWKGLLPPAPPELRCIDCGGRRRLPETSAPRTYPFVWVASRIAELSSKAYTEALRCLRFRMGIIGVSVDPKEGMSFAEAEAAIRRWSVFSGHSVVCGFNVKDAGIQAHCQKVMSAVNEMGKTVAHAAESFVVREHELLARERSRRAAPAG
jgi:hypothetical protein